MKFFSAFVITSILLSACSSTGEPRPALTPEQAAAKKGYEIVKPVKQVRDYTLDGWNYIDKQNLLMHSTPSKKYLLTFKRRCHDLNNQEHITFETRTGVLMAGLDAIKVPSRNSSIAVPCYIENIYLLKKIEKANPDNKTQPEQPALKEVAAE